MSNRTDQPDSPGRRAAMRRLGLAVVAAYVVPEVVLLSEARASGISPPSVGSYATPPTPPTPPSEPSTVDEGNTGGSGSSSSSSGEAEQRPEDACQTSANELDNGQLTITESDFKRAQASVEAGYAKPLEAVWADFVKEYSGRVIGIEFTGYRYRPRYRMKAISPSGHLETVIVSARTGEILRIIGC